jgi:hypothetical protein
MLAREITKIASKGGPVVVMMAGFALALFGYQSGGGLLLTVAGMAVFLTAAAMEMYVYLQTVRPGLGGERLSNRMFRQLESEIGHLRNNFTYLVGQPRDEVISRLGDKIEKLEFDIKNVRLKPEERDQIAEETIKSLSDEAAKSFLQKWEKEIAQRAVKRDI